MSSGLHRISDEWRLSAEAPEPWLRPGLRRLGRDAVFRTMLWMLAAVALAYPLTLWRGVGLGWLRDGVAFVALGGAAALALALGSLGAHAGGERRLHRTVAVALASWACGEFLETFAWSDGGASLGIAIDALYLGFYAALFVAMEAEDGRDRTAEWLVLRRVERIELAVFLVGLLLYFVVVPARTDSAAYLSAIPSSIFYLWLDLLLLLGVAWRGRRARRPRERFRWTMLRASAVFVALTDSIDLSVLAGRLEPTPVVLDLLWYLPFLTLVAAVRSGPAEPVAASPSPGDADAAASPPTAVPHADLGWGLAALMPMGHLVTETFGGLESVSAAPRRLVVGVATAALVGLAARHQRIADAIGRRLFETVDAMRARRSAGSRMEAIGELAGGVAHDFRHLVDQLRAQIAAFESRALDERTRRDLEAMSRAADRARNVTQELLAVGQRDAPRRRPLELRRWLREIEPALVELCGDRVPLTIAAGDRELWCAADAAQLERVASNLVVNAREAMPDGGRLEVRLEAHGAASGQAVLRFRDEGSGMDRATCERVFEPFFTTKTERVGHGLGLATALGLVRAHGGDIRVASEPGRGSTFEVWLPLEPAAGTASSAGPSR